MPHYEVTVWRRTPTQAGPPTFEELGPLIISGGEEGAGLSWSRELYSDGSIVVATNPTKLQQEIAECLLDLEGKPCELALYRDGILRQRGPLVAWQIQGSTMNITARGLLYYLRYMTITTDMSQNQNQVLIAKALIDHHQNKDWGDFGLDTSTMVSAGSTRAREYAAADLINVADEIRELGEADNGFDIDVDPETREITCFNPTMGTDISDLVALDHRGIVDPAFSDSVAAGQFGSAALIAGVPADSDPITATSEDATVRNAFGLAYVAHSAVGVASSAELAQIATRTKDLAKRSVFLPPKEYFTSIGAGTDDFDIGDTISSIYDAGFSPLVYVGRVKNKFVSVQEGGQDKLTIEFV